MSEQAGLEQAGLKWSVAVERAGIPIGWSINGANGSDVVMVDPTLDAVEAIGLIADIGTLSLDRGYDYPAVRAQRQDRGLTDLDIQMLIIGRLLDYRDRWSRPL